MRGHLGLTASARLEGRGELAVQRAPAQPRDVLVDRVAGERVAERGASGFELDDQAAGQELVETGLEAERGHELDVEAGAGHGRGLGGRPSQRGQVARLQQHGVADRPRQRHIGVERQLEAVIPRPQAPS